MAMVLWPQLHSQGYGPATTLIPVYLLGGKCPLQGNGRVYIVSEAATLRQLLCFLPVLGNDLVTRVPPRG